MGIVFGPNDIYKVKINGSDNASVINDNSNQQLLDVTPNNEYLVYQIVTEKIKTQSILFDQERGAKNHIEFIYTE